MAGKLLVLVQIRELAAAGATIFAALVFAAVKAVFLLFFAEIVHFSIFLFWFRLVQA